METLRIYRPRVILHGPVRMGQTYVGPAVLHHLEGYHVQSLELGSLMSDSTRVRCTASFHALASLFSIPDGRSGHRSIICRSQTAPTFRHLHPCAHRMVRSCI